MQQVMSKDISMAIQVGNVAVSMNAENVSWTPDVADDMKNRMLEMLREACSEAASWGMLSPMTGVEPVYFDDGSNAVEDDEDE